MPNANADYWQQKIQHNRTQDANVCQYYNQHGWNVLRVWEHEVKRNFDETFGRIVRFIEMAKRRQS
ncbi:DUF559 domain-containing protein [Alicyclobacillus sp. ALC3]|uniref:DUF559 domain-containing protein n=1 Tax=Alicyclobacillus sp. ALC3 TaxID=2796143 RepID=UPI0023797805|nr:DUF559 domain-containing protein [Alicyclobacillus sp. ALC3]